MVGIYKITSPSKRVYVGQSLNIERRFKTYEILRCKGQTRLYSSFIKYGIDNHKFEIIQKCNIDELNELERYYQELYNCIDKNGLNCQYVKTNTKKYKHSQETKDKIGIATTKRFLEGKTRKGFKITQEHKDKIGKANKGNKRPDFAIMSSQHNKLKIGSKNNFYGRKHSKETIKKLSDKNKGKRIGFDSVMSKIILNLQTGIYYNYSELADLFSIKVLNSSNIKSKRKSSKYYQFIEV